MQFNIFGNANHGWSCSYTDSAARRKLNACPFCGGVIGLQLVNTHTPYYWVECHGCGAQGPQGKPDRPQTALYRTKKACLQAHQEAADDAIDLWNEA